jgi:hypothetical protein
LAFDQDTLLVEDAFISEPEKGTRAHVTVDVGDVVAFFVVLIKGTKRWLVGYHVSEFKVVNDLVFRKIVPLQLFNNLLMLFVVIKVPSDVAHERSCSVERPPDFINRQYRFALAYRSGGRF